VGGTRDGDAPPPVSFTPATPAVVRDRTALAPSASAASRQPTRPRLGSVTRIVRSSGRRWGGSPTSGDPFAPVRARTPGSGPTGS
jgi:hypothetical protein